MLEESEKAAAAQPGTYREEENESKVVEIGKDKQDAPIQGIDPEKYKKNDGR